MAFSKPSDVRVYSSGFNAMLEKPIAQEERSLELNSLWCREAKLKITDLNSYDDD